MLKPESVNPLLLPRRLVYISGVPPKPKQKFPHIKNCCVYFIVHGINILYIGSTVYLYDRWSAHTTKPALKKLKGEIYLYWLETEASILRSLEAELIKLFNPELNKIGKRRR